MTYILSYNLQFLSFFNSNNLPFFKCSICAASLPENAGGAGVMLLLTDCCQTTFWLRRDLRSFPAISSFVYPTPPLLTPIPTPIDPRPPAYCQVVGGWVPRAGRVSTATSLTMATTVCTRWSVWRDAGVGVVNRCLGCWRPWGCNCSPPSASVPYAYI